MKIINNIPVWGNPVDEGALAQIEVCQKTAYKTAMMIYKESSPIRVSPPRFFENNETAMADMKKMAELESKS